MNSPIELQGDSCCPAQGEDTQTRPYHRGRHIFLKPGQDAKIWVTYWLWVTYWYHTQYSNNLACSICQCCTYTFLGKAGEQEGAWAFCFLCLTVLQPCLLFAAHAVLSSSRTLQLKTGNPSGESRILGITCLHVWCFLFLSRILFFSLKC